MQLLRNESAAAQARGCSNIRVLVTHIQTHNGINKIQGLPDLPIAEYGKVNDIQPFLQTDQAKRLNQGPR
jgi:hypothetical protein